NKSPCSNPRSHLLAHTDYDPEDKSTRDSEGRTQKQRLIDYEKQYKRPNHAVESAYLAQDILKQSLIPLLRDHFAADDEQMKYICHTVIMAAGRHHSAWASGWDGAAISQSNIKSIQLHPQAKLAIADSWRSMTRFLPQSLPLPKASLSKDVYPIKNKFDLNRFTSDQTEYLQLYLLVVRALRLCDQR
ncbi:MAG: CRISPR-associated helicase Cas3, partial [Nostoc sp.]